MVKPNDVVALVIGLHILLLIFVSYGLIRLVRAMSNLDPDGYSYSSESRLESSDHPLSPVPPEPVSPPRGEVNVDHGAGGQINVDRGAGGQVNVQRSVVDRLWR
ncbi:hypothetical protein F4860DRAFT_458167 [Xylaria cubensis]|nr:hypothetical protein F4860DRAFT_458167 [Xylaria cubensis]